MGGAIAYSVVPNMGEVSRFLTGRYRRGIHLVLVVLVVHPRIVIYQNHVRGRHRNVVILQLSHLAEMVRRLSHSSHSLLLLLLLLRLLNHTDRWTSPGTFPFEAHLMHPGNQGRIGVLRVNVIGHDCFFCSLRKSIPELASRCCCPTSSP
uniref:(northern house mosquito) hypothetical protein n=1 Tax=Culex pipiens TaxID=7175 RepID=A0A8D8AJ79_CULPI